MMSYFLSISPHFPLSRLAQKNRVTNRVTHSASDFCHALPGVTAFRRRFRDVTGSHTFLVLFAGFGTFPLKKNVFLFHAALP